MDFRVFVISLCCLRNRRSARSLFSLIKKKRELRGPTEKLRLDYNDDFLDCVKQSWRGDFEDFLGVLIEDRLMHLRSKHIHECKFNYIHGQLRVCKIDQMIENFHLREDKKIDAKIESDNITSILENQISY